MKIPRYKTLRDVILYELYIAVAVRGYAGFDSEHARTKILSKRISTIYIEMIFDSLRETDSVVRALDEKVEEVFYKITHKGIQYVEENLDTPANNISQYEQNGSNWLFKDNDTDSETETSYDLENDEWKPLPINRESQDYEEAISVLDEAIDVVAGNNGYAESEPDERNNIVESLRQGQKAIKEHQPSKAQIDALVLRPLRFLARKFSESTIGEIAKVAVVKIIAWLASFL